MEVLKSNLGNIKERVFSLTDFVRSVEGTRNIYNYPFPQETVLRGVIINSPAHSGSFAGALDFLVELGTPVLAPVSGVVAEVVDGFEQYGPTREFKSYLNYLTIRHDNGEYSQPAHLAKRSVLVKVGQRVEVGQPLAVTGQSGWMTEPHLHLLVFRLTQRPPGFKGLKINFRR